MAFLVGQVGMHGAGMVNAYFLRPGAAFVEVFPCRFWDASQAHWSAPLTP